MSTTIITALVGLFCTLASSVTTFFLTKRKYNVEVDNQEIDNVNDAFELFKKVTNETIKLQNDKIDRLQKENDDLREQVRHLQKQMLQFLDMVCYDTTCKLRRADMPTEIAKYQESK